jgi:hypothetical protein
MRYGIVCTFDKELFDAVEVFISRDLALAVRKPKMLNLYLVASSVLLPVVCLQNACKTIPAIVRR